jgi:hypothetical protein
MATVLPYQNESFLPWLNLILGSIDKTVEDNKERADQNALQQYAAGGFQGQMPDFLSRAMRAKTDEERFRLSMQNSMAGQTASDVNTYGKWQGLNQMRSQVGAANPAGLAAMGAGMAMGGMPMAAPSTATPPPTPFPALPSALGQALTAKYAGNLLPMSPMEQAQLENEQARTKLIQTQQGALAAPTRPRLERVQAGNPYGLPTGSVIQHDENGKIAILWKPEQEKTWDEQLSFWQEKLDRSYKKGPLGEYMGEIVSGMEGINLRSKYELQKLLSQPTAKPVPMVDREGAVQEVEPQAVMNQLDQGWRLALSSPGESQTTGDAGVSAPAGTGAPGEPQTVEDFIRAVQNKTMTDEQARAYYERWVGKFQ